jgi:predicted DsbA family dithiol-disulfide isomerase
MRVDIWSDIVCPWCYLGKRQFEQGLAEYPQREQVEVVYHAFELDPSFPPGDGTPILELLATKYGMSAEQAGQAEESVAARVRAAGLPWTASRLMGNTFDAHRIVRLGLERGRQEEVLQHLYEAYFGQGQPIFGKQELTALAASAGLDADEAEQVLLTGAFTDAVREDEAQAQAYGINGVPFAVLDRRYGVSGAQPAEVFTAALAQAAENS